MIEVRSWKRSDIWKAGTDDSYHSGRTLLDGNDWADQWKVLGKVRQRKRQKDNLLRLMKHFFQIKNQQQDITRVGG